MEDSGVRGLGSLTKVQRDGDERVDDAEVETPAVVDALQHPLAHDEYDEPAEQATDEQLLRDVLEKEVDPFALLNVVQSL